MEVDEFLQSQDVLQNDEYSDENSEPVILIEPWILNWTCKEVTPCEEYWPIQSNKVLTPLEQVSNFFTIGDITIPVSEISTKRGIIFLFGKAIEELNVIQNLATPDITNYLKVLSCLEFVGYCDSIPCECIQLLVEKLPRLLKKIEVNPITGPYFKNNLNYHIAIYSWKTCIAVYARLKDLKGTSQNEEIALKLKQLLITISDVLVKIHAKYNQRIPCECSKMLLIILFKDRLTSFSEAFLSRFDQLRKGCTDNIIENNLLPNVKISAFYYFSYYANCFENLIQIKAIDPEGELSGQLTLRTFQMANCISKEKLVSVCEVQTNLLTNCQPCGLDKCKTFAKNFWNLIINFLTSSPIPYLELLRKKPTSSWSHEILELFPNSDTKDVFVISLIAKLFSVKSIWNVSKNLVDNSLINIKNTISDDQLGTLMSLYLSVFAYCSDPETFGRRFCDWLGDSCSGSTLSTYETYFVVLDVMCRIAEKRNVSINIEKTLYTLFNNTPLPSGGSLFNMRLSLHSNEGAIQYVDLDRAARDLNQTDFTRFISILNRKLISSVNRNSVIKRCSELVIASKNEQCNHDILLFFTTWLRKELEKNSQAAHIQLSKLIEAILSPSLPSAQFVFHVTNSILTPPKVLRFYDSLIPCWIAAVYNFDATDEIIKLTESIWSYLLNDFKTVGYNLDPFDGVTNVFTHLEVLILALGKVAETKPEWVRDKVIEWVPTSLANQLVLILNQNANSDKVEHVLNLCCKMFCHITTPLFQAAKPQQGGFSGRPFVILLSNLLKKFLSSSPTSDLMKKYIVNMVSSLNRLPFNIYVNARIKDIIVFLRETDLCEKIVQEVKENAETGYYKQLQKYNDHELKRIISKYS